MSKRTLRRVTMIVTTQTACNLKKLARMSGYGNVGLVVDKLVREKMIQLRAWDPQQNGGDRFGVVPGDKRKQEDGCR